MRGPVLGVSLLTAGAATAAFAQASGGASGQGASGGSNPQTGEAAALSPFSYRSPDGVYEVRLNGLLSFEAARFSGSGNALTGRAGSDFRDAAASLSGRAGDVRFAVTVNGAASALPVEDAYLAYAGAAPFFLVVGNHKEPFSLQVLQGSQRLALLEPAQTAALSPGRMLGASLSYVEGAWTASFGAYAGNVNRDVGGAGHSYDARLTFAPLREAGRVLHLGAAANLRAPGRIVSFGTDPESQRAVGGLVGAGELLGVRRVVRANAEAAVGLGPVLVQAEYAWAELDRARGVGHGMAFQGAYLQAAWLVTGEARPYLAAGGDPNARGTFDRPRPRRPLRVAGSGVEGHGALELVLRESFLDLGDAPGRAAGRERNLAVGVNWFLDDNLRLAADLIRARAERHDPGRPHARVTVAQIRAELRF